MYRQRARFHRAAAVSDRQRAEDAQSLLTTTGNDAEGAGNQEQ
jgi:hypothetical protein